MFSCQGSVDVLVYPDMRVLDIELMSLAKSCYFERCVRIQGTGKNSYRLTWQSMGFGEPINPQTSLSDLKYLGGSLYPFLEKVDVLDIHFSAPLTI